MWRNRDTPDAGCRGAWPVGRLFTGAEAGVEDADGGDGKCNRDHGGLCMTG